MAAPPDPNDLAYWYPLVKELAPTPKTVVIETGVELLSLVEGEDPPGIDEFFESIISAGDSVGWPCFLRTGHLSAKHEWRETCCLRGRAVVPLHVVALVEASEMAGFMGLPYRTWVVRELLETAPAFFAFTGRMPIAKERRYFAREGAVLGYQPYWPPDSILDPSEPDWAERLEELNRMSDEEVEELAERSRQASAGVPGAWSIDWLFAPSRGWLLTDMAVAADSFVWEECPTAPDRSAFERPEAGPIA